MSIERLDVIPNRTELIKLKNRKILAEGIVEILEKELDILIISLFEYRERAFLLQSKLNDALFKSYRQFVEAEMLIGSKKVMEIALTSTPRKYNVAKTETTGVLGIKFHIMELIKKNVKKQLPRMSLMDTPMQLEEAATRISKVMDSVVELASLTEMIREIIDLITLKRRQVSGVRFTKIPQLDLTIKFIENILEEVEHQDAIRIRVLQRKRKEKVEKSHETG